MGRQRAEWGSVKTLRSGKKQASYNGPNGRRYLAPHTFDTMMDARAWLHGEKRDIDQGVWIAPENRIDPNARHVQFRQYAEKWLIERDLKAKTLHHYRDLLETRVYTAFGERRITAIATPMVRTWLAAQDGAPTRKAQAYGLLKAILTTAVQDGVIDVNPCQMVVKAPKRREIELLTPAQLWDVYDEMNAHYRPAVLVLSLCGLRFGECIELRRKDIRDDGRGMALRVRRAAVRVGAEIIVGTPKSDEGVRDVVVPGVVADILREHLKTVGRSAESLVFTTTRGERLSQTAFTKNFKAAVESKTGRIDVRVHDLRHLGGTLAAQAGATTKELMDRLGHATPVMALRYQHTAAGRDAAIADRLGEIAGR